MRVFSFLFVTLLVSQSVYADVRLYCEGEDQDLCIEQIAQTLTEAQCELAIEDVSCANSMKDKTPAFYCWVKTPNCGEPSAELFGFTANATKCYGSDKVNITKINPALSLGWMMGFFSSYVPHVCVSK